MPFFMFVSGYIYSTFQKPIAYNKFILNKFNRLIVPYLFVSTLVISIKLLTENGMYLENPVSLSSFYEIFYMPSAGFFLWFIYALFLIFIIIPFFNTPARLNIFLILSLILLLIPVNFTELFNLAPLKRNLFYFVLGCFICSRQNIKELIYRIPAIIFALFFAIIYIFPFTPLLESLKILLLAISGLFFIMKVSIYIDKKPTPVKQFLLKIAPCSYTIYLFHTTAEGFAKAIFFKINIEKYFTLDLCFIIQALIIIISGVFLPIVIHKIAASGNGIFGFLIGMKYSTKK
jgi:fucose 4-O-acetylase-like acetyltransferase